jgi:hypothetical protein
MLAGFQDSCLDLRRNALSAGTVPSEMGRLTRLTNKMILSDENGWSGTLPTAIGRMTHLQILSVSNVQGLSGPIPFDFCRSRPTGSRDEFQPSWES